MEKLDQLYYKFEAFFLANPKYAYLLVAVVLVIFGIFSLLGKRWALDPSGSRQRRLYKFLGEKWFARILGVVFLFGAFGAFVAFLYTE